MTVEVAEAGAVRRARARAAVGGGTGAVEHLFAAAAAGLARVGTDVRGEWRGCVPHPRPRVYFANHTSHGDFLLLWTALPPRLRRRTRPVAAADYWRKTLLRRFFGERVFRAVLIDRAPSVPAADPVAIMARALDGGASLILFPEGTRNVTDARLLPFRTGLYHLARARPRVELVPVWIENLDRVMPKGQVVPVPLLCTVTFGPPLRIADGEDKRGFLARTRAALLDLASARTAA